MFPKKVYKYCAAQRRMQSGTPFAGFRIRLIYGALGLALCAICATGVNIWLIRRRERGTGSAMWGRLWIAVVWGQPLALALAALVALRFDPLLPYVTLTLAFLLFAAVADSGNDATGRNAFGYSSCTGVVGRHQRFHVWNFSG
jgi:hypothetical protein